MKKLIIAIIVIIFIATSCIIYQSSVTTDVRFKGTKIESKQDTAQHIRKLNLRQ